MNLPCIPLFLTDHYFLRPLDYQCASSLILLLPKPLITLILSLQLAVSPLIIVITITFIVALHYFLLMFLSTLSFTFLRWAAHLAIIKVSLIALPLVSPPQFYALSLCYLPHLIYWYVTMILGKEIPIN